MSLLAVPLDDEEMDDLRQLFPEFTGEIPEEVRYWARSDVELFLGSGGQLRPKEVAQNSPQTCALLTNLRLKLADDNIDDATAEYKSFCRHRSERDDVQSLPTLTQFPVQRAANAPDLLKAPVVLPSPKTWRARDWGLDFWRTHLGQERWWCRSRAPAFEGDLRGPPADRVVVDGTAEEYVEYAKTVHASDPSCSADNAVAFPRAAFDGWCPFCGRGRGLFEQCRRELLLPGARDLSARWVRMFATAFDMDWLEVLARYFRITLGTTGCCSRLHTENHGAHVWFSQLEGRRMFVLFSPSDAAAGRLYEESGSVCDGAEASASTVSPVDVFFPNCRRHPTFLDAQAHVVVLRQGETLLVPGGWWRFSVALEPSVTLHHPFWNAQNRARIVDEFREAFDQSRMPPELQELAAVKLQQLHENIMEDDDSDMDE